MADDPNRRKKNASRKNDNSAASMESFKNLLKEGYTVRDLFYNDGISVLFERVKQ